MMPGFAADCLETPARTPEIFKHSSGEQFAAIPCLNGMDVIRTLNYLTPRQRSAKQCSGMKVVCNSRPSGVST
jgi:protoheme ferro-lyase